ncbi:hypothetical protein PRZ48_005354 [Zasmidium cellare]|uniref:Uncharacterized protein n=1 Tax=Zasmidium cellare TaxID=395010 RepID=A0ABR0ETD1_ZASCE|nr:hypothetical protein PRZ48_005354 [Zasmidium cellare]
MAPTDFINSQSPQKSTPIGNTPGNVISMATLRREEDEMNISAVCVDVDGVSDQIHGSHQQAPSAPVETMLPQTPASIGSLGADPRSALAEMDASRTNAMNESRMNQTTQSYEPLGHAQLPWWHALEDNTPWTDADVMRDAECHKWQRSEARQARLIRGLADMEAVVQSMELTFDSVLKPLVDARATVDQMGACGVVAPTTPPGDGEDQWHGAECTKTIWSTADLSGQALYGSLSDLRRRLRWFSTDLVGSGDEEYVVGKRI